MGRKRMKRLLKWPFVLLAEWLCMAVIAGISLWISITGMIDGMYLAVMWVVIPLAGAALSYLSTRRGLNNFAAWLAPAICPVCVHWLMFSYPPASAGMPLLCAFLAIVAAATAEVMNVRGK